MAPTEKAPQANAPQENAPQENSIQGYMTDHTGKPSNMRLMSTLSIVVAIGLTALVGLIIYQGQETQDLSFLFNLILVWIVAAFAPKAVQKYIEGLYFPSEGARSGLDGPAQAPRPNA